MEPAHGAKRERDHRSSELPCFLGNARHERAQAQEERTQHEAREQEGEKVLCDPQEEQQNGEGTQRADKASDWHEHFGNDEGASDTCNTVGE